MFGNWFEMSCKLETKTSKLQVSTKNESILQLSAWVVFNNSPAWKISLFIHHDYNLQVSDADFVWSNNQVQSLKSIPFKSFRVLISVCRFEASRIHCSRDQFSGRLEILIFFHSSTIQT